MSLNNTNTYSHGNLEAFLTTFVSNPTDLSPIEKFIETFAKMSINPRPNDMDYNYHYFLTYIQDSIRLIYPSEGKLEIFKIISEDFLQLEKIFPKKKRNRDMRSLLLTYNSAYQIFVNQTAFESYIPSTEEGEKALEKIIRELENSISKDYDNTIPLYNSVLRMINNNSGKYPSVLFSKESVEKSMLYASTSIGYVKPDDLMEVQLQISDVYKSAYIFFSTLIDQYIIHNPEVGEKDFSRSTSLYNAVWKIIRTLRPFLKKTKALEYQGGTKERSIYFNENDFSGYQSLYSLEIPPAATERMSEQTEWSETIEPVEYPETEYEDEDLVRRSGDMTMSQMNTGYTYKELSDYDARVYKKGYDILVIKQQLEEATSEISNYNRFTGDEKVNFSLWKFILAVARSYTRKDVKKGDSRKFIMSEFVNEINSIKKGGKNYDKEFDNWKKLPFPYTYAEFVNKVYDTNEFNERVLERVSKWQSKTNEVEGEERNTFFISEMTKFDEKLKMIKQDINNIEEEYSNIQSMASVKSTEDLIYEMDKKIEDVIKYVYEVPLSGTEDKLIPKEKRIYLWKYFKEIYENLLPFYNPSRYLKKRKTENLEPLPNTKNYEDTSKRPEVTNEPKDKDEERILVEPPRPDIQEEPIETPPRSPPYVPVTNTKSTSTNNSPPPSPIRPPEAEEGKDEQIEEPPVSTTPPITPTLIIEEREIVKKVKDHISSVYSYGNDEDKRSLQDIILIEIRDSLKTMEDEENPLYHFPSWRFLQAIYKSVEYTSKTDMKNFSTEEIRNYINSMALLNTVYPSTIGSGDFVTPVDISNIFPLVTEEGRNITIDNFQLFIKYMRRSYNILKSTFEKNPEKCPLGFIIWKDNNCWFDTVLTIVLGIYNRDFDTKLVEKFTQLQEDKTDLILSLERVYRKLKNSEHGSYACPIKAFLPEGFPKRDEFEEARRLYEYLLRDVFNIIEEIVLIDEEKSTEMNGAYIINSSKTGGTKIINFVPYRDEERKKDRLSLKGDLYELVMKISNYYTSGNDDLTLYAFIINGKQHYVSYFLCHGLWRYYDDKSSEKAFSKPYNSLNDWKDKLNSTEYEGIDLFFTKKQNLDKYPNPGFDPKDIPMTSSSMDIILQLGKEQISIRSYVEDFISKVFKLTNRNFKKLLLQSKKTPSRKSDESNVSQVPTVETGQLVKKAKMENSHVNKNETIPPQNPISKSGQTTPILPKSLQGRNIAPTTAQPETQQGPKATRNRAVLKTVSLTTKNSKGEVVKKYDLNNIIGALEAMKENIDHDFRNTDDYSRLKNKHNKVMKTIFLDSVSKAMRELDNKEVENDTTLRKIKFYIRKLYSVTIENRPPSDQATLYSDWELSTFEQLLKPQPNSGISEGTEFKLPFKKFVSAFSGPFYADQFNEIMGLMASIVSLINNTRENIKKIRKNLSAKKEKDPYSFFWWDESVRRGQISTTDLDEQENISKTQVSKSRKKKRTEDEEEEEEEEEAVEDEISERYNSLQKLFSEIDSSVNAKNYEKLQILTEKLRDFGEFETNAALGISIMKEMKLIFDDKREPLRAWKDSLDVSNIYGDGRRYVHYIPNSGNKIIIKFYIKSDDKLMKFLSDERSAKIEKKFGDKSYAEDFFYTHSIAAELGHASPIYYASVEEIKEKNTGLQLVEVKYITKFIPGYKLSSWNWKKVGKLINIDVTSSKEQLLTHLERGKKEANLSEDYTKIDNIIKTLRLKAGESNIFSSNDVLKMFAVHKKVWQTVFTSLHTLHQDSEKYEDVVTVGGINPERVIFQIDKGQIKVFFLYFTDEYWTWYNGEDDQLGFFDVDRYRKDEITTLFQKQEYIVNRRLYSPEDHDKFYNSVKFISDFFRSFKFMAKYSTKKGTFGFNNGFSTFFPVTNQHEGLPWVSYKKLSPTINYSNDTGNPLSSKDINGFMMAYGSMFVFFIMYYCSIEISKIEQIHEKTSALLPKYYPVTEVPQAIYNLIFYLENTKQTSTSDDSNRRNVEVSYDYFVISNELEELIDVMEVYIDEEISPYVKGRGTLPRGFDKLNESFSEEKTRFEEFLSLSNNKTINEGKIKEEVEKTKKIYKKLVEMVKVIPIGVVLKGLDELSLYTNVETVPAEMKNFSFELRRNIERSSEKLEENGENYETGEYLLIEKSISRFKDLANILDGYIESVQKEKEGREKTKLLKSILGDLPGILENYKENEVTLSSFLQTYDTETAFKVFDDDIMYLFDNSEKIISENGILDVENGKNPIDADEDEDEEDEEFVPDEDEDDDDEEDEEEEEDEDEDTDLEYDSDASEEEGDLDDTDLNLEKYSKFRSDEIESMKKGDEKSSVKNVKGKLNPVKIKSINARSKVESERNEDEEDIDNDEDEEEEEEEDSFIEDDQAPKKRSSNKKDDSYVYKPILKSYAAYTEAIKRDRIIVPYYEDRNFEKSLVALRSMILQVSSYPFKEDLIDMKNYLLSTYLATKIPEKTNVQFIPSIREIFNITLSGEKIDLMKVLDIINSLQKNYVPTIKDQKSVISTSDLLHLVQKGIIEISMGLVSAETYENFNPLESLSSPREPLFSLFITPLTELLSEYYEKEEIAIALEKETTIESSSNILIESFEKTINFNKEAYFDIIKKFVKFSSVCYNSEIYKTSMNGEEKANVKNNLDTLFSTFMDYIVPYYDLGKDFGSVLNLEFRELFNMNFENDAWKTVEWNQEISNIRLSQRLNLDYYLFMKTILNIKYDFKSKENILIEGDSILKRSEALFRSIKSGNIIKNETLSLLSNYENSLTIRTIKDTGSVEEEEFLINEELVLAKKNMEMLKTAIFFQISVIKAEKNKKKLELDSASSSKRTMERLDLTHEISSMIDIINILTDQPTVYRKKRIGQSFKPLENNLNQINSNSLKSPFTQIGARNKRTNDTEKEGEKTPTSSKKVKKSKIDDDDEDEIEIIDENPNPIFKTPNFVTRLYQKIYVASKDMQSVFPPNQDKSKYGYPLLPSLKIGELKQIISNKGISSSVRKTSLDSLFIFLFSVVRIFLFSYKLNGMNYDHKSYTKFNLKKELKSIFKRAELNKNKANDTKINDVESKLDKYIQLIQDDNEISSWFSLLIFYWNLSKVDKKDTESVSNEKKLVNFQTLVSTIMAIEGDEKMQLTVAKILDKKTKELTKLIKEMKEKYDHRPDYDTVIKDTLQACNNVVSIVTEYSSKFKEETRYDSGIMSELVSKIKDTDIFDKFVEEGEVKIIREGETVSYTFNLAKRSFSGTKSYFYPLIYNNAPTNKRLMVDTWKIAKDKEKFKEQSDPNYVYMNTEQKRPPDYYFIDGPKFENRRGKSKDDEGEGGKESGQSKEPRKTTSKSKAK